MIRIVMHIIIIIIILRVIFVFIPSQIDSKYIETISLMDGEDDDISQIHQTNNTTTIQPRLGDNGDNEYNIKSDTHLQQPQQTATTRHLGVINLLDDDWNSDPEDNE
eukprot:UN08784